MSNIPAEPLSKSSRQALIAERVDGGYYPDLARKYGISDRMARYICRRAVKDGLVTAEQVRLRYVRTVTLTEAEYNARWLERTMKRVIIDERGCWRWTGFKSATGYSQIPYKGRSNNGHRSMYKVHYGVKLETEQYCLHRCDVRDCINPEHLWIGTAADNNRDCAAKGRHYEGKKTHCVRGHEFTPENTKMYPNPRGSMSRKCLTCDRARWKGRKTA